MTKYLDLVFIFSALALYVYSVVSIANLIMGL